MVLVGATGLVGRAVMARAAATPGLRLGAIARRRVTLPHGARMEMFVAEPSHWGDILESLRPDVVVCALGTTWGKSGKDEAAFRAVDEGLVLDVARMAKSAGTRQMIVVSAAGADRASRHLYMRVKSEMEDRLAKVRLPRLDIIRPGLLRGKRTDDARALESAAMALSPILDLLLHGRFRKYRSISSAQLADAIIALSQEKANGRFIHEFDAIRRAARRHAGSARD